MGFSFRPARREQTPLLLGLAGPSGSGKTASALKLARGILGGEDEGIFVIDTEAGRATHYACSGTEQPGPFRFRFQHCDLTAPFSPARYGEAIEAAVKAGARAVVVDSMSHSHEGPGGLLEAHEQELQRMAGNDYAKRERVKFAAWIRPKQASTAFVNLVLQLRCHMIFAFRAKDKLALIKKPDGKTEPVSVGWTPICSDRFEYEMTTMLMLPPNGRGVPDLNAPATKINEHHRVFFAEGEPIGERHGQLLADWARGGQAPKPATPTSDRTLALATIKAALQPLKPEDRAAVCQRLLQVGTWDAVTKLGDDVLARAVTPEAPGGPSRIEEAVIRWKEEHAA